MAKLVKEIGKKGRLHIDTPLMGESLVSKEFIQKTESEDYFRMRHISPDRCLPVKNP